MKAKIFYYWGIFLAALNVAVGCINVTNAQYGYAALSFSVAALNMYAASLWAKDARG